jgi:Sugar kinases, ribokinase family
MDNVLCIGELLIDFIGEANDTDIEGQSNFLKKAGGAPANVACTIAAVGGNSLFCGSVGKDGFGDFLENTLKFHRVDTQFLKRSEKATTLAFVSIESNGERDFIFVRGADADLCSSDLPSEGQMKETSIVHFGAATSFLEGALKNTYKTLLEQSLKRADCITFDPNYRSAFWHERKDEFVKEIHCFMESADLIKLSDEEAFLVTQKSNVEEMAANLKERYDATIAITLGANGALLFNREWQIHVPAVKAEVVDTTGAGDAFIGALLYKLSLTGSPKISVKNESFMEEAATFAASIAAKVCSKYGALTALEELL